MKFTSLVLAYLFAPFGAAPVMLFPMLFGSREIDLHAYAGGALLGVMYAYFHGFMLLPLLALYEWIGLRGWRVYMPTALAYTLLIMALDPSGMPLPGWGLSCGIALSCSGLFSLLLLGQERKPANDTRHTGATSSSVA